MPIRPPVRFVLTSHVEEHEDRPATTTYAEIFDQITLADACGFDAVWLAEHHFGAQQGRVPQPLLVALAAAERTARIKVGTSLIVLPIHHPLELAEQLATLDLLAHGRLSIGLGSGSAPFEFAGFDAPFDPPQRHARFREALEILERAWTGESFSHDGGQFTIGEVHLVPRPTRPLREFAWIGAMSEQSAAMAGEFGYGLQLPRGFGADHYAGAIDAFRDALHAHHGPDAPERLAVARCVYVGPDDDAALAQVGTSIQRFYETSKGYDRSKPTPSAPELIDRLHFVVGGPEKCARELAAFAAATGLSHVSIQPNWIGVPHAAAMASLRRFGEDVMPRVSALLTAEPQLVGVASLD